MAVQSHEVTQAASKTLKKVAAHVRKTAAQHTRGTLELNAVALELAAGLCSVVASSLRVDSQTRADDLSSDDSSKMTTTSIQQVIEDWSADCAPVLSAMSGLLAELEDVALARESPPRNDEPLPIVTARLVTGTKAANRHMTQAAESLRMEAEMLTKRASEVGTLKRMLQKERLRHREQLGEAEQLARELDELRSESGPLIARIEKLQQTLEWARDTATARSELEMETQQAQRELRQQEREVARLETSLSTLREKLRSLPERRDRTLDLLEQLKGSRHHKLFREIQKIWQRLPVDTAKEPLPDDADDAVAPDTATETELRNDEP